MSKSNPRAHVRSKSRSNPVEPREEVASCTDLPNPLQDWQGCHRHNDPADSEQLIGLAVQRRPNGLLDDEEAWQEAWLVYLSRKAIDGAGGYDLLAVPPRFVMMIRHHLADQERRARRRKAESLTSDAADSRIGREEDPAVTYERGRIRALVWEILAEARERLSETSHRIIFLRGIDECSFEEIAEIVALPVSRVRDRHRRAMANVRELIHRRFAEELAELRLANSPTDLPTSYPSEVMS